jgi:hypothetical protein
MEVSMRTLRRILVAPLVIVLALSSAAAAEDRHAVDPARLTQILAAQVAKQDADRAAIHAALNRPAVRDVAQKSGIDLDRLNASVDTLSGGSLAQVAAAAERVNQTLIGGESKVVISSTTIIIALLVAILIIVAVR